MANPEAPRSPDGPSPTNPTLTRRRVLGGMAGIAGLATVPSLLAACSPAATTAPSTGGGASNPAPSTGGGASTPPVAGGKITFGSNYSDEVPKKAMQAVVDGFKAKSGIDVSVNTVEHGKFQDTINAYLQATPDDTFTWFAGYRMRFFAAQGLATDISDVWGKAAANYSDAFKTASTGDDGKQYFIPFYNYPWVVIYRKSFFTEKGYTIPKTIDEFKTLGDKMKTDGLIPLAFGDKDGWPAMGTFDILNMRMNGYDFHVGLMAGTEKWTDAKTKAVFQKWAELLPYFDPQPLGKTWQEAAQDMIGKKAGMYFLGTFAGEQATDPAIHDDLDFFPFPTFGTQYDSEAAIDAPIDGFMVSAKAKNADGAKAFMEYLATGEAQGIFLASSPNNVAAANDADTSKYTPFQKKMAEIIGGAQKIAQFLDRDTRPDFAGANSMQGFLQDFLGNPSQDLDKFLSGIQSFYDSLPPAS